MTTSQASEASLCYGDALAREIAAALTAAPATVRHGTSITVRHGTATNPRPAVRVVIAGTTYELSMPVTDSAYSLSADGALCDDVRIASTVDPVDVAARLIACITELLTAQRG